jgi:hypothetical protein
MDIKGILSKRNKLNGDVMASLESTYERIIYYLLDLLEDEHMGMYAEAIKLIKEEFDVEL